MVSRSAALAEEARDPARERELAAQLTGTWLGQPLQAFQQVGSTMDLAHRLAKSGHPEGSLVWAARQTQGRGRLGRPWASPPGGIYLSFILRPRRSAADIPQLALVTGLACAEAVRERTGLSPAIRWPNDLLLDERKVAGILVEAKDRAVIIGVGVNLTTDPGQLPDTATSLKKCLALRKAEKVPGTFPGAPCGKRVDAALDSYRLTGELCRRFGAWYDAWTAQGFEPIRQALRPWLGHFGRPVHITAGTQRLEGVAQDLDERGRLVVRLDTGILRMFEVGEVTLLR
jgi:BirA family biotin operon repressor/biotin-[acetyl-CoA-carboxylase] ligase